MSINSHAMFADYIAETPEKDWSAKGAAKALEVTVEIPSIPAEDRLIQYYKDGFLKYEPLVSYLSTRHGIPIEHFEEKPQLDIKELNGEFEKPDAAGPAKKKAKK